MPEAPAEPGRWVTWSDMVGPWTAVEELHANLVEKPAAGGVRLRAEGAAVRMRGQVEAEAAHEMAVTTKLFVVPAGFRPTQAVFLQTTATAGVAKTQCLEVKANGEVIVRAEKLAAEGVLILDGLSWHWM